MAFGQIVLKKFNPNTQFKTKRFFNRLFGPPVSNGPVVLPAPVIVNVWQGLGTSGTPIATTSPSSPASGNLLVVFVGSFSSSVGAFTITNAGPTLTWTTVQAAASGSISALMYYAKSIGSGVTSVTVTGGAFTVVSVFEISGASTTSPLTDSNIAFGSASGSGPFSYTSPTIVGAVNSLLLAGFTCDGSSATAPSAPFANVASGKDHTNSNSNELYNVGNSTSTTTGPAVWTSPANNGNSGKIIAAFSP